MKPRPAYQALWRGDGHEWRGVGLVVESLEATDWHSSKRKESNLITQQALTKYIRTSLELQIRLTLCLLGGGTGGVPFGGNGGLSSPSCERDSA